MADNKKLSPAGFQKHYKEVTTLIEGVKKDSLLQFGEIKKEFGNIGSRLDNHQKRLTTLEEDKIKRDAIEAYKKEHPEVAQKAFDDGKAYNDNAGITINKELLTALKYLGLVVAALAAAIIALKVKP